MSATTIDRSAPPAAIRRELTISKRRLRVVGSAVVYAAFVTLFPWDLITIADGFSDFNSYVEYFNASTTSRINLYAFSSLLQYFTGEVLWDVIVRWLTGVTGDAAIALRLITFFICLVWGVFLFSRLPRRWALAFLLNPTSLDVALSGVRNGFAWSLFILGTVTARPLYRYTLFGLTPFIHSSSAVLLAIYLPAKALLPKAGTRVATVFMAVAPGLAIGLALTVLNEFVFGLLGDRRLREGYFSGGGSIRQSLFWMILVVTQLTCSTAYLRRNGLVVSLLVWYLVMNPLVPWSYRIWGAAIPLIAVAIWDLPKRKRQFIWYLYLGYLALWYLYWTNLFSYWYYP